MLSRNCFQLCLTRGRPGLSNHRRKRHRRGRSARPAGVLPLGFV